MSKFYPQVTRRSFIKHSSLVVGTVAACSPTIVPYSVFGGNPPSETVTVGLIGTGRQCLAKNYRHLQRQPDCRILAVCDVDSWRMNEVKKKVDEYNSVKHSMKNGCDAYGDYNDLLARDDIDAVMISTPDHWHEVIACDSMRAGKDVLLEKPIIRTIREGQELRDESAKLGKICRVDSDFRIREHPRRAFCVLQSGVLGNIHKVTVGVPESDKSLPPQPEMPVPKELDYKRWLGAGITQAPPIHYTLHGVHAPRRFDRPGWMQKLNFCDGMVANWGTHLLNGALWCLGLDRKWPVEISGTGLYPYAESFWNVLLKFEIQYKYANGMTINYRTDDQYMRFEGDKGWIDVGFWHFKASDDSIKKMKFDLVDNPKPCQTSEKRDFLDSVKSRKPGLEPAEVGHHVNSTCLLGHFAVNLGETLKWDGNNERFIDNDRANAMLDKPIVEPNPELQEKKS